MPSTPIQENCKNCTNLHIGSIIKVDKDCNCAFCGRNVTGTQSIQQNRESQTPLQKKIEELIPAAIRISETVGITSEIMQELATWVVQTVVPEKQPILEGKPQNESNFLNGRWNAISEIERNALQAGIELE